MAQKIRSFLKMLKEIGSADLAEYARLVVAHQLKHDRTEPLQALLSAATSSGDHLQAARLFNQQKALRHYSPNQLAAFQSQFPSPFLNVGGGPTFLYPLWKNLDGAEGPLNPEPFQFAPQAQFPFDSNGFELVYSSHTLEHLDTPTVIQVLQESRRVLRPNGALVIKIPDFDAILASLRNGDHALLDEDHWNFGAVMPTWASREMFDTAEARASYLFCGFWNTAYGDLFGSGNAIGAGAYNGPAVIAPNELSRILAMDSPHAIAMELRQQILDIEQDFTFNHQNAWGRNELAKLLTEQGFDVLSDDALKIEQRYNFIPRLSEMREISQFIVATPVA
jgi:SAM-dependent methyltransferase